MQEVGATDRMSVPEIVVRCLAAAVGAAAALGLARLAFVRVCEGFVPRVVDHAMILAAVVLPLVLLVALLAGKPKPSPFWTRIALNEALLASILVVVPFLRSIALQLVGQPGFELPSRLVFILRAPAAVEDAWVYICPFLMIALPLADLLINDRDVARLVRAVASVLLVMFLLLLVLAFLDLAYAVQLAAS